MTVKNSNRWIAAGTLSAMSLTSIAFTSTPAQAVGSSTWKKIAIAGAAVGGYGLIKGKGRVATVGAATAAGSYYMYRKQNKKEAKRQAWYKQRYGANWRSHYKNGS